LPASIFIVNVDNVGSNQMHQIRQALRGKGQILMGKNTMFVSLPCTGGMSN
jgi:large subunit ribosomal protein LP0